MISAFLLFAIVLESPSTAPTTRPSIVVGHLHTKIIRESSGLAASRKHSGVYWTHNDSGNGPEIFAIDARGKLLQRFQLRSRNRDWEDIAIDDQDRLYIADTGNNEQADVLPIINRLAEPDPTKQADAPLTIEKQWTLAYPDKPFDCESLFVRDGKGYLISKRRDLRKAGLYEFELTEAGGAVPLKKIADLPIRMPVTSADLSSDGQRLAVMTVAGPFLFDLPEGIASIAKSTPRFFAYARVDMEAVCFTGDGLLATRESGDAMMFRFELFK